MEPENHGKDELLQMLLTEKIVRDRSRHSLLRSDLALESGIALRSEEFFLLSVDVVDWVASAAGRGNLPPTGPELDRAILTTAVDTLDSQFRSAPFISDNDYFLLVNLDEPLNGDERAIKKALDRLTELGRQAVARCLARYGVKTRIFISHWIPSLDELGKHFSYFRLSISRGSAPDFDRDVVTSVEASQWMTDASRAKQSRICACERKIASCALDKDISGIRDAFFKLIDLESDVYPRTLSMNDRAASRIECLFGLLDIPYFSDRYPYLRVDACLESVREAINPEELKETISGILEDFRAFCFPAVRPMEVRVIEVTQYIDAHYTDPELSADQLSARFGISPSYLSTVFKEKIGVRLLDYIHQRRLAHAKRLLCQRDLTVEAVAAASGYHSALTLTRAFKRYTGVTPGQFRLEHLLDEPE